MQGAAIEALLSTAGVWLKKGAVKPKAKNLTAAYYTKSQSASLGATPRA
jgi:hypothetical protein